MTVRRCEKPMLAKRWWKCQLSAWYTGWPYLMRFAITKLESRIGTARITSGKTSATTAFVFNAPCTAIAASMYPSRFDPESPRKIEAG